jgi:hypothetical protein
MDRKAIMTLMLVFSFIFASPVANDALAEKDVLVRMEQSSRCVNFSDRGMPPNTRYELKNVQVRREGITGYSYDDDKGVICFEPLRVGTTNVIINVDISEYEPWGRLKETRKLTRRFRVKVRYPRAD